MTRISRCGIKVASLMVAIVFLLNATGVIDQTEAARELGARGAPSSLVSYRMPVGRSIELIGGLALMFIALIEDHLVLRWGIRGKTRHDEVLIGTRQAQP